MEFADAEIQVRTLGAQLLAEATIVVQATRNVVGIRKILDGYVEMFPELQAIVDEVTSQISLSDEEDGRPRGAEAVRQILQDSPNMWFRVSELVEMLRDRGWLPESENPANAVRTALERLVANSDESDIVRGKYESGNVVYQYAPDRDRSPETPGGYGFNEEPF